MKQECNRLSAKKIAQKKNKCEDFATRTKRLPLDLLSCKNHVHKLVDIMKNVLSTKISRRSYFLSGNFGLFLNRFFWGIFWQVV